jgi:outer membrane lipoprotein SlyB
MKRIVQSLAVATLVVLSAGCAHQGYDAVPQDSNPVVVPSRGSGADAVVQYGVVSAIDRVEGRRGGASGVGAAIGALAGALFGREMGHSSDGRANGVVFGTMAGAILGNEIERDQNGRRPAVRVSVRLEQGGARSFDFGSAGDLRVGDRVRIEGRQLYRM